MIYLFIAFLTNSLAGSFMAAGLVFFYYRKAGVSSADLRGATERLELHLKYVEGELSKHDWCVSGH